MASDPSQDQSEEPRNRFARQSRWHGRNPEKRLAHRLVRRAKARGAIQPQPCERCGQTEGVHGHHEDYNKPLAVTWLCPLHHKQRHREMKGAGH